MTQWILIALGVYLLAVLIAWVVQERFIFHPEKLAPGFRFRFQHPFSEVMIPGPEGHQISGLLFKASESRGVVFYFKGNTRSIKGWSKFAFDFTDLGYDCFMIDYPGFGKSLGKRTEQLICEDACVAYEWLQTNYAEEQIVIYGRSFGAGFAAYVASKFHLVKLILDSPYYSFLRLANYYTRILPLQWILRYKIPLNEYLHQVQCPVYIIHGTSDRIIPFKHSMQLMREEKGRIRIFPIEGGNHNNLPSFKEYHQALKQILIPAV